jgi:hypothetical protein
MYPMDDAEPESSSIDSRRDVCLCQNLSLGLRLRVLNDINSYNLLNSAQLAVSSTIFKLLVVLSQSSNLLFGFQLYYFILLIYN